MRDGRRGWRPTPRGSAPSLGEFFDTATLAAVDTPRYSGARPQVQRLVEKQEEKKKRRKRRGKAKKPATVGVEATRGPSQHECKVVISNMVAVEELVDRDERDDVEEELRVMLRRHGEIQSVVIDGATGVITATYTDLEGAHGAVSALDSSVYGSRAVSARLESPIVGVSKDSDILAPLAPESLSQATETERDVPRAKNKRRSKLKSELIRARSGWKQRHEAQGDVDSRVALRVRPATFIIRNMLDPEELEDDDEYDDVYHQVHADLSKHGDLERLTVVRKDDQGSIEAGVASIVVRYQQAQAAKEAFRFHDGKVFGGRQIACAWIGERVAVRVGGMLEPGDLEDADEFEDVQSEVADYFSGYDHICGIEIVRKSGDCIVECESEAAASELILSVSGKKYGGRSLTARRSQSRSLENEVHEKPKVATDRSLVPISNAPAAQHELTEPPSAPPAVTELAVALLKRLAALQERAHVQNPQQDRRSRRLVVGLHEVRRGISQRKIRLLVIGTGLEDAEPIGDAVRELVTAANEQEIPVIWPMSRRRLGRVLKKNVRVSCVGVYSVDGANDIFRQLLGSL